MSNIPEIERKINQVAEKYQQQLEQLDGIPGIDMVAAQAVLAEIGTDMSRFKTAAHLCSWAGLSPGNNESAGKKVRSHNPREPLPQASSLRDRLGRDPYEKDLPLQLVLESETAPRR
jgi:transposase